MTHVGIENAESVCEPCPEVGTLNDATL